MAEWNDVWRAALTPVVEQKRSEKIHFGPKDPWNQSNLDFHSQRALNAGVQAFIKVKKLLDSAKDKPQTSEEYARRIGTYIAVETYEPALNLANDAIDKNILHSAIFYQRAHALRNLEQPLNKEALKTIREACALEERHKDDMVDGESDKDVAPGELRERWAILRNEEGLILLRSDLLEEARAAFEAALGNNPKCSDARYGLKLIEDRIRENNKIPIGKIARELGKEALKQAVSDVASAAVRRVASKKP